MKQLRRPALIMLAIIGMALAGASSASATALEVGGAVKNEEVNIEASLKPGTSLLLKATGGEIANTCTAATLSGHSSSPFVGTTVSGPVSTMTFSGCTEGPVVVDAAGNLSIERIGTTTNGTVRSTGAKVTVPSPFGSLTCTTAASPGTDIGTLTGVASGNATMDINAVLNCGFFLPSAKWEGTYTVTSPEGLGVTSPTALEVGGVSKGESVAIKASLKSGTSTILKDTGGAFANTCTASSVEGKSEAPYVATAVSGKVSALSFSSCTSETVVVDEAGSLSVEYISGTTNGTVRSTGAKVTTPSPFGSLTCTTAASPGTDIGTLTGVASGNATMDINAVLNCGFFLPSAKWEGTYTVTSPEGLGVTSTPPLPPETALEVGGVRKSESVAIKASLKSGTSTILKDTGGAFANTCTASSVEGKSEAPYVATTVSGKVSALSFSSCTNETVVVDEAGSLSVEYISGTTNGTVRSTGAKVTTPSPFGSLTCATTNTDIGTLTGVASGNATMDINAVLNCGFFLPSAKWEGTYTVTSPEGLGVTS